jgi:NAD(P)H dehydrogenase (quinone)
MNVLIVHAHHEPRSFCSAMKDVAAEELAAAGHEVVVSDLYAMGFDPVSDRRNFTTVYDGDYLKQQLEERHATKHGGFAPDVEQEIAKLEACDLLMFVFPLWWFGMPAILKGWVDRVAVAGRIYGGGKWYDHGIGAGKRAIAVMTTGGPESMYLEGSLNGSMDALMYPVNHGVFWFLGFSPLPQEVAWGPAHVDEATRAAMLDRWRGRVRGVFEEAVIEYPGLAAFNEDGSPKG